MADKISGEFNKLNGELLSINDNLSKLTSEVIDLLGSGIVAYTLPERKILVLNQEARRMFDAPEIEAGKSNFNVMGRVIQEDREAVSIAVRKLKYPGDITSFVFHNLKMDGSLATFKCTTKLLSFADGSRYILSSLNDITEQEAIERRIEEERMRYKAALSIGSMAFITIDLTDGMLNEPIITRYGENLTEQLGLEYPVFYDNFARKMFSSERIETNSDKIGIIRSRRKLLAAYKEGTTVIDLDYTVPEQKRKVHLIVMLHKQQQNTIASFIFYDSEK
ncbi:MAG: hypothetical protein IKK66_07680 [Ruminococcus sp.]|nr:hypothetical protein [Ruminococcus sp.]